MKDDEDAPSFEETPPTRLAEAVMAALADRDRAKRQEAIETASTWADPEELLACVGDQSDSRRRNAAMDALVRGGLRSVPVLIKALRHGDPEVVMFAAGLLGKTRDASAVPHLIRLLEHGEMNVVMSSIDSLGQLRSPAAVGPIARLMERDTWLRFAGIYALGEIGDDRAVDILLPLLADPTIREMVILALGKIGSARAFPALAGLLRDGENPSVFARVLCAVGRILETNPDRAAFAQMPAWIALTSPTAEEFHRSLAVALMSGGPEEAERDEVKRAAAALICALELEALYADLVTAGGDPKLGKTLQFWSLSIGPGMGPALLDGLLSPEAGVRSAACRCIGSLGLRDALPRLAALLEDGEDMVRAAAVQAIADLNGVDVIGSVVRVLKNDQSLVVRDAARAALGRMDPVVVLAALLLAPPSSVEETVAVLEILAANPHPHGVAFTRVCLEHPAPEVRRAAVVAAARLPGMQASGVVDARLDDPSVEVRREAVAALAPPRRLKVQQRLLYMVANDRELRDEAVRSLSRLGDPVIAARIVQILMNEAATCDVSLAEAVAALAQPTCEPLLRKLLSSPLADVRRIAVTALGRFGSTPALGSVAAAARDPDAAVRRAAIEALARGGQFDALERLAMDPDPGVARGARRCIEDLGRDRDTGRSP